MKTTQKKLFVFTSPTPSKKIMVLTSGKSVCIQTLARKGPTDKAKEPDPGRSDLQNVEIQETKKQKSDCNSSIQRYGQPFCFKLLVFSILECGCDGSAQIWYKIQKRF